MRTLPFRHLLTLAACLSAIILGASALSAWSGPSANPTSGNIAAPVTVGSTDQVKDAGLSINALAIFGTTYVSTKVGVGRTSPVVATDVNGSIRAGNGGETCNASLGGAIRYNASAHQLEYCNESAWTTVSPPQRYRLYGTAGSYTFTVPSGVTTIRTFVIGGGGGGGGGNSGWGSGAGGGCGGAVNGATLSVTPGQQISVTVGGGGAGGGGAGANGSWGGTSSFGSVSASGGSWGKSGYYNFYGATGGSGGGSGGGGGGNGWPGFYQLSSPGGSSGNTNPYAQASTQTGYDDEGNPYQYTQPAQSPGGCQGGGWSVNPGTYITRVSWSAGSGGYVPVAYQYYGGGGGGGVVINGSTVTGASGNGGSCCPAPGGQGYGGGGGGVGVDYYTAGGNGAQGAVYVEW